MAENTRIQCDVLVIGGGMAGLAAAVSAAEEGADVVLASLGEAGKSGATYYDVAEIGALNAPCACETDSAQVFYEDIMTAGLSMASEKLCRILAENAEPTLHRLAAMPGGENLFERENNKYKVFQACFSSKPRSHIIHDHFRPLLQYWADRRFGWVFAMFPAWFRSFWWKITDATALWDWMSRKTR